MYKSHWQLSSTPFSYRTEPNDLYRSASHQAASLRLRYCFANDAGAVMLLGNTGVGKSTLLQQLRYEEPELRPFTQLSFSAMSSRELLRTIALEVTDRAGDADYESDSQLAEISNSLLRHSAHGRHAVVTFDEAHLLSNDSLNEVVLPLLNLADAQRDINLSVVLCGQPVLASHVSRNAQLRERIAIKATLENFSSTECGDYIQSRMLAAGGKKEIFTRSAIDAIFALSSGNPRRINRLCDMSLLVGYADQLDRITASEVESLAVEFLPAAA